MFFYTWKDVDRFIQMKRSAWSPWAVAIEVYATTLHYCPIQTSDDGFGCVVALIKDTNTPLESKSDDKLLFAKNKWLISHVDNESLIKKGAFAGVYGEDYKL